MSVLESASVVVFVELGVVFDAGSVSGAVSSPAVSPEMLKPSNRHRNL